MKSLLVRWTASLGISLGILLGMGSQNFTAYALPEGDIERILAPIPVFMVTDGEGKPLTASSQEGEQVAGVFISRSDAQSFITNLGTNNPDLARQLQVSPIPLMQIVRQARSQNSIQFEFVSSRGQVEAAQQVQQDFQGTPLFAAKAESTGGYLSITVNDRQVIPFFFEKQKLDALVNRFTQQNPNLANSINVQIVPLEAIIDTLANSDEEGLKQIVLVLSDESLQFVRSLQQQTP